MTCNVVWFKRDLRVHDHAALEAAVRAGPVLCLYVIEPGLWRQADASTRHYAFLAESLRALDEALARRGARLQVVVGEMPQVLDALAEKMPLGALYSHEETGNDFTYARDRAVGRWCRERGVRWHQFPQFGVVRGLRNRDDWLGHWQAHVTRTRVEAPEHLRAMPVPAGIGLRVAVPSTLRDGMPRPADLGLSMPDAPRRQPGGRPAALAALRDFLSERSGRYRGGISSPLSAPTACSRISPYLAWGCISLREVVQATRREIDRLPPEDTARRKGLAAFLSRLHWHCHFIQKLESEPELEWRNLHRGYDGLREDASDPTHLTALMTGRTGWPLVDACVAMLEETGWINFRMRAMLVSVAAYPLWLHWRGVGEWLARQFVDYEPGIHWSQMQMQSGTTGINTTRVYNPVKQAQDHDPKGVFVRRWLPAMRRVPDAWLFEPWRMPEDLQARCGVRVGEDIARPLVELASATREAKARVHALRARPEVRAAKAAILERHGSRKRPDGPRVDRRQRAASTQLSFDL
jgi:deoxyribodipyrimidine photo-lyase